MVRPRMRIGARSQRAKPQEKAVANEPRVRPNQPCMPTRFEQQAVSRFIRAAVTAGAIRRVRWPISPHSAKRETPQHLLYRGASSLNAALVPRISRHTIYCRRSPPTISHAQQKRDPPTLVTYTFRTPLASYTADVPKSQFFWPVRDVSQADARSWHSGQTVSPVD